MAPALPPLCAGAPSAGARPLAGRGVDPWGLDMAPALPHSCAGAPLVGARRQAGREAGKHGVT